MPWMDDALDHAAAGGSWSVLLRHAERPPIPSGEFGNELSITEGGRRESEAFGAKIGGALVQLVSSPVRRCIQTAEAIRAGAGATMDIVEDRRLGHPGVWVTDPHRAGEAFRAHGTAGVIKRQLNGEVMPGMRNLGAGTDLLMDLLAPEGSRPQGMTVMVTHDAVIAPFVGHVLASRGSADTIPSFLEGPLLAARHVARQVHWRGEAWDVRLNELTS